MSKVLVTGGRSFFDEDVLFEALDSLHAAREFTLLIHGAASGADWLAEQWAYSRGVKVLEFPASWAQYGKSAGPIRNRQMLDEKPDIVVAFPGGKGTANMVGIAQESGVEVVTVEGKD